jgi:hypothetical protein
MVPTAAERSNVLVRWTARSWCAAACTCDSAAAVRGPEIRFLGPFSRVIRTTRPNRMPNRRTPHTTRIVKRSTGNLRPARVNEAEPRCGPLRGRILDFRPARGGVGQLRRPGASAACRRVQPAAVSAGRRGVRCDSRLGRIPRLRSAPATEVRHRLTSGPGCSRPRRATASATLSNNRGRGARRRRVPCTACQSDHTFCYHVRRRITT